jgi:hypothetical protein
MNSYLLVAALLIAVGHSVAVLSWMGGGGH